jgi:hypothetical protein
MSIHTWLVPQDPVQTELGWDISTRSTTRLATAATTDGVRGRGHRTRSLSLLSDAVCELIDVNIGRFLVPREPGWELHLEVWYFVCSLAGKPGKLCRGEANRGEGNRRKGCGQESKPYTTWRRPAPSPPQGSSFRRHALSWQSALKPLSRSFQAFSAKK